MRIAFITNIFPQLSETFVLNQITGLIDRGHTVDIFTTLTGSSPHTHEDVHKYNLMERTFYINRLLPKNKLLRIGNFIFLFVKHCHKNLTPLLNSINIFKYGVKAASLQLFYQTVQFLDRGPYDVIHAHFGPNGNLCLLFKELQAVNGKVITAFHGYDMSRFIKDKGDTVYNSLFTKGDLFLPISEYWKNALIKLGCKENKILVHRMGVAISKYNYTPRNNQMHENVHLLTIARLVEKKGIEYSLKAVARVIKKHPNIEYKIVGDGPLKMSLQKLINDLGITINVKLLGWKNQEEIIEIMKSVHILLASSVTAQDGDQEGIPVVLMEALAQGIPVISTQHSGIPELIQDGVSGFLVPERDIDQLTEKLSYLVEHQDRWEDFGRAGRAYVQENYNIDKLNDQLVDIYKNLIRGENNSEERVMNTLKI